MILIFQDGQSFATGAIKYSYQPATQGETTNRIILPVEIEDIRTEAVIDTGAPYVICPPRIARVAGIDRAFALERLRMLIRGTLMEGSLTRLSIRLLADEGECLTVDATVFVPDVEESWGNLPAFIGLTGFLERLRFAIDPSTDTFYFGSLL